MPQETSQPSRWSCRAAKSMEQTFEASWSCTNVSSAQQRHGPYVHPPTAHNASPFAEHPALAPPGGRQTDTHVHQLIRHDSKPVPRRTKRSVQPQQPQEKYRCCAICKTMPCWRRARSSHVRLSWKTGAVDVDPSVSSEDIA